MTGYKKLLKHAGHFYRLAQRAGTKSFNDNTLQNVERERKTMRQGRISRKDAYQDEPVNRRELLTDLVGSRTYKGNREFLEELRWIIEQELNEPDVREGIAGLIMETVFPEGYTRGDLLLEDLTDGVIAYIVKSIK